MQYIKFYSWNKKHPLVLKHGNLKTEKGKYIFSCEEAEKVYPGSTIIDKMIKYTWEEYKKSGRQDAVSYYPGEFALCNIL